MIEFYNVSLSLGRKKLLNNITFRILKGEFVYLTGVSGVGKSTILKMIYFDQWPDTGNIIVNNYNSSTLKPKDIPILRRSLGVVFQDFKLLPDRNVYENVALALRVTGNRTKEIKKKVMRVLTEVQIWPKRNHYPRELSGGEQQRVAIARALVNNPAILLADEPTGNLDSRVSIDIMNILERINQKGTAILMATHDLSIIREFPHKRMELENGMIGEE